MPRKSPEAMAAAMFHTGGKAPAPPDHLDRSSKVLWREITRAFPCDFFKPGATQLLEAYCIAVKMHRFYQKMWDDDPGNPEYSRGAKEQANAMAQLAQKLRLSNSARIHRHSGMLNEKETQPIDESDGKVTTLFGAGVKARL